jgi:hypothetical protein
MRHQSAVAIEQKAVRNALGTDEGVHRAADQGDSRRAEGVGKDGGKVAGYKVSRTPNPNESQSVTLGSRLSSAAGALTRSADPETGARRASLPRWDRC